MLHSVIAINPTISENEVKKLVLEKQTEAIVRAIFILGKNRLLSY